MQKSKKFFRPLTVYSLLLPTMLLSVASATANSRVPERNKKIFLHRDWQIQSSCQVPASGQRISAAGFSKTGWHHAEVPTTVVAALVADKTYPDPYSGMNLKSFPGMNYSPATFFANQSIPDDSPFHCSWWFRTEFPTPALIGEAGGMAALRRDQLSRQHLAERGADSDFAGRSWNLPNFRVRSQQAFVRGKDECPGRRSLCSR